MNTVHQRVAVIMAILTIPFKLSASYYSMILKNNFPLPGRHRGCYLEVQLNLRKL